MDFARRLFGGSEREHRDFVDRYEKGPGALSGREAAARYEQVAPNLPPEVFQQSARDVFAQMTPEQRMQLGQNLVRSSRQHGADDFPDVNGDGIDDRLQDPEYLARTTARVHQQKPDLLGQVLGGLGGGGHPGGTTHPGGGSVLNGPVAQGVLGGIAAYGISRMLGGGHHGHKRRRHHGGGFFDFEGPEMELGLDDVFEGDFGEMDFGGDD